MSRAALMARKLAAVRGASPAGPRTERKHASAVEAPCRLRRGASARPSSPVRRCRLRNKRRLWRGGAPLPIPNREVKPRRGDDTARKRGKVARRPPTTDNPVSQTLAGLVGFILFAMNLHLCAFLCIFASQFLCYVEEHFTWKTGRTDCCSISYRQRLSDFGAELARLSQRD